MPLPGSRLSVSVPATARSASRATAWACVLRSAPRAGTLTGSRAVGGWHGGGLVTAETDSPHHAIAASRAEFAFGHADHDRSMPPEAVAALGEALTAAGRPHTNEVYEGAAHGYTMADTSVYDEAAAERHFAELRALLDRTLR